MEDATKVWLSTWPGVGPDADDSSQQAPDSGAAVTPEDNQSLGEKRQDRWFLENRDGEKVPKKLEIVNEMQVTSGGPLKLRGNITLIDEDGGVTHANQLTLCRCGGSNSGPHCDNRHVELEFLDNGSIGQASDCLPAKRPQTVTVTCVKNGPLKFRGFMRIFNRKGQEYMAMQGALCRCGRSAKKPFCDCA
jgi:CDGSH-type Zn-finger protein